MYMFQLNPIGNRVGIDFPKIFHAEWSLPFQIGMFGRKYTGESLDSREKQRPFYSLLFSSTGGANLYKLVYIYIYWYIHIFCSVFSISFDFDIRFDILEEKMIPSNLAVISCSIGLKTANYLKSHFWWSLNLFNFHVGIPNLLQGMAWTELKLPREEDEMGWSKCMGGSGLVWSLSICHQPKISIPWGHLTFHRVT